MVRELNNGNKEKKANAKTSLPEEYESLKDHLSKHFKTKVDLKRTNNGKGKIIIPFKSDDDLERILAVMDQMNS